MRELGGEERDCPCGEDHNGLSWTRGECEVVEVGWWIWTDAHSAGEDNGRQLRGGHGAWSGPVEMAPRAGWTRS